ncbi:MAG: Lrp/AsnC family transcriptional regulator [Erysipelotrichaceae bacterium]|nr:Lrp/AsnC family transcriptional regulator [Erysipelotrichaceae bacterium]MDY6034787.1 Lrp/AsnC family transcriptional regulator [Bulleidia sp.]
MDEMKLLDLLVQNPRESITDLAEILGESQESVQQAKKSLEDKKIICGYHTMVNWDKTNIDHVDAIIGVSAKPERGSGYDKIATRIAKFPEVSSLFLMSGNSEFLVNVNGKTMREVADFVGEKLAPIEGVAATVTMFVLKKYKVNGVTMDMASDGEDERMPVSA